MKCIYADEEPAGCGTSKFCSTCGAAIAIVTSLSQNEPVERTCALTARKNGQEIDIALKVRSHPITIDDTRFLLLFLQDITVEQQRAALERTFFHDINNILGGLVGASDLLSRDGTKTDLIDTIHKASLRLQKEVEIQNCFLQDESRSYHPLQLRVTAGEIEKELCTFYANHPVRQDKYLHISTTDSSLSVETDISLLLRVLCNMITNALEATEKEGMVTVSIEHEDSSAVFCVHNSQIISEDIGRRIFQRNFSTKPEAGRGTGTFSMKLFGEKYLGGKLRFASSREDGTIFKFSLPL